MLSYLMQTDLTAPSLIEFYLALFGIPESCRNLLRFEKGSPILASVTEIFLPLHPTPSSWMGFTVVVKPSFKVVLLCADSTASGAGAVAAGGPKADRPTHRLPGAWSSCCNEIALWTNGLVQTRARLHWPRALVLWHRHGTGRVPRTVRGVPRPLVASPVRTACPQAARDDQAGLRLDRPELHRRHQRHDPRAHV